MRLDHPGLVRREYATEDGLRARRSIYRGTALTQPADAALAAVAEGAAERVLEVGCGWGEFAARLRDELHAEVTVVDMSPRMVELARDRGLEARVADVQDLPFGDGEFDCVVANWMLYHVADLDRALGEVARVLQTGGRLAATTTSHEHLAELWSLVGRDRASEPSRFFAETGELTLRRHFGSVERRLYRTEVTFPDTAAARGYVEASVAHKHLADPMPELDGPLTAQSVNAIFIAEKAA